MNNQTAIPEITIQVDGEFTDLQLVENIRSCEAEKAKQANKLKLFREQLVTRLQERGVTQAQIGDDVITIGPKMLGTFDHNTLASLKNCTTEEQVRFVIQGIPSGKQMKELSTIAGASAKAVIESAKRKIETDTIVVKIKRPRKASGKKREHYF
jgi:hypothetical protein